MNNFIEVNGKPFFMLGGQAHNSTTYSEKDLTVFWNALHKLNANTAEIPIYWEAIEPIEGKFDFSSVELLMKQARSHQKRLVLLWFATWKNGGMRYCPEWVKNDTKRFARVISHDGNPLFVLSSHCRQNIEADKKAFCAFISHLKQINDDQTVIAVQVENEAGIAGRSYRDFGIYGEKDRNTNVPEGLLNYVTQFPESFLYKQWLQNGKKTGENWGATFGVKCGAESLTAYSVSAYINEIAQAGKEIYPIPMYINVALDGNPWRWNLPGTDYTGGGPVPHLYPIWKYNTPALDIIAPDIYQEGTKDYERVCAAYDREDNPLFVPESPSGGGRNEKNMFYAIGTCGAIGYAPFGIESMLDSERNLRPEAAGLADSFQAVSYVLPLLIQYRKSGKIRAVIQHTAEDAYFFETSKYRVKIDFDKNGYLNYHCGQFRQNIGDGRGFVIETAPDEFYLCGIGFTAFFARIDDYFYSEDRVTNHMPYQLVEEGCFDENGAWQSKRIRTGDECDHGIWVHPQAMAVRVVLCE